MCTATQGEREWGRFGGKSEAAGGTRPFRWLLARRLKKKTRSDKIAGHQSREESPQTRSKFAGIGGHVDTAAQGWNESGSYSQLYPD